MTTSPLGRLAVLLFFIVGAGACSLQSASGQIGKDCGQARECDDDTLGCVPVDFDNPALGKACMPPPEDWICDGKFFGDRVCDCGCELIDIDCASELGAACADNGDQCPEGKDPDPLDNSKCI